MLLALILALNTGTAAPDTGYEYIDGAYMIEIRKAGQMLIMPQRYSSQSDCVEIAPLLEQHSNFQGWQARCIWYRGWLSPPDK